MCKTRCSGARVVVTSLSRCPPSFALEFFYAKCLVFRPALPNIQSFFVVPFDPSRLADAYEQAHLRGPRSASRGPAYAAGGAVCPAHRYAPPWAAHGRPRDVRHAVLDGAAWHAAAAQVHFTSINIVDQVVVRNVGWKYQVHFLE